MKALFVFTLVGCASPMAGIGSKQTEHNSLEGFNMPKQTFIVGMTLQFDNPVQSAQFGAPVMLTNITIVTNAEGQTIYQPAHVTLPATPEDITDELLEAIQIKMLAIGLRVTRL